MSQSLRRTKYSREPEKKETNPAAALGQFVLLIITLACGVLAYYWLSSDISGEYMGQNKDLGQVTIVITRKPANIVGDITYGREQPAPIIDGQLKPNGQITLKFQQGASVFQGKLSESILKGSLYLEGAEYPLSLERNPLATLHQRIQTIFP